MLLSEFRVLFEAVALVFGVGSLGVSLLVLFRSQVLRERGSVEGAPARAGYS